ncbi:MAG: hypothetical protein ACLTTP_08940 [Alistipes ihumii]
MMVRYSFSEPVSRIVFVPSGRREGDRVFVEGQGRVIAALAGGKRNQ